MPYQEFVVQIIWVSGEDGGSRRTVNPFPSGLIGSNPFSPTHSRLGINTSKENTMFYYLYQITNLVNAKIYVGVHKTRNMNDGYMGSGKVILRAMKKHGTNNFEKVILETFADAKSMYAREKEVVNESFLSRKDVYNLRRGGTGGFDYQ